MTVWGNGAAVIAQQLQIPIVVEKELHEWNSDMTHTITSGEELLKLCQERDCYNGIYPQGQGKLWESDQLVKKRVEGVMEKYLCYEGVVIAGHAMMMQAVTGIKRPFSYGEIVTCRR